jgi:hypothetical protein
MDDVTHVQRRSSDNLRQLKTLSFRLVQVAVILPYISDNLLFFCRLCTNREVRVTKEVANRWLWTQKDARFPNRQIRLATNYTMTANWSAYRVALA